jgi:CheY-like chemotaxis protein
VEVDEGQISQVINNLVINAQQAMPGGGTVKVKAENINTHAHGAEHKLPLEDGRYLRITIEDNGLGIPEELLSKIFDPYFTTKQNGSGLGLATTYSIVKNHNGHIELDSKQGVGTQFFIYLPVSVGTPQDQKVVIEEIILGSGRILVMDDEEAVRETIGEILEHLGYTVDYACDGGEAIEKYGEAKSVKKPFDAVIMDLTIPAGMSGKEAIQQLLKIDSRVKAIASSGYSDNPVMSEFDKHGFKGVIAKPYNISELSKILKRVIAEENR